MDVYVAKNFPSVVKYEMKKGDLNGKIVLRSDFGYQYGAYQRNRCETFKGDVKATIKGDKATYEMTVKMKKTY